MSPARRRTTLAILALAVGGFAIGTTEFVTMGLLPQIAEGTGVDIATAGHYVSAYALGVVVGAPLIAVAAAKVPRKGLLMGLMAFFAVAHLAILAADSYPTVMAARFLAGLPHGAFFGIGSVVAASLVSHHRRTAAVAAILGGLGVANVVGVPVATLLGQRFSWHLPYVLVGAVAALTVVAIALFLPHQPPSGEESMRAEMQALRRVQVWLALLVGVVGFGGMFAMYSFITPTMTELAGLDERYIPWVLAAYGIGMVAGMVLSGRIANRVGVLKGIIGALGAHRRAPGPLRLGGAHALARRRHGLRPGPAALDRRAAAPDAPDGRRPRGAVARRRPQPLDAQHRERARCLARLDRAGRRVGLRRAEPRRCRPGRARGRGRGAVGGARASSRVVAQGSDRQVSRAAVSAETTNA